MTYTKQRCIVLNCGNHRHQGKFVGDLCTPCYTFISTGEGVYSQAYRNVQRPWVGLTDEEMRELSHEHRFSDDEHILAIMAALKEKNT